MVHAADILGFLMGDVTRVYTEGKNLLATDRRPQIDCAVCTLRFASGAIGVVNADMVQHHNLTLRTTMWQPLWE